MAEFIYAGDYGHAMTFTITEGGVAKNISTASAKGLVLVKPDGTQLVKTPSFYSDGSDGKLLYTTLSTDLDLAGTWQAQANVTTGGGVYHSQITTFTVYSLP